MNRHCSLAGVPLMSRVHSHQHLYLLLVLLLVAGLAGSSAVAQDPKPADKSTDKSASQDQSGQDVDPLKRPLEGKKKKQQMKDYTKEIKGPYKKWLDEDVAWIITDEERSAFKQLSNDEERDQFIEAFWQRRDPTPDTEENEYKEDHYARIAYANEHFAEGTLGWKTDPGRA